MHQAGLVSQIVRPEQIAWVSWSDPWHFSRLCGTLLSLPYLIMSHLIPMTDLQGFSCLLEEELDDFYTAKNLLKSF